MPEKLNIFYARYSQVQPQTLRANLSTEDSGIRPWNLPSRRPDLIRVKLGGKKIKRWRRSTLEGIDVKATEADIEDEFNKFGTLRSVWIGELAF